jgi:hypothetical protein
LKDDDVICAICHSGESLDEDPIILCDGSGASAPCNLAVHTTCYSVIVNLRSDEDWRCDPCEFQFRVGKISLVVCSSCGRDGGALKRAELEKWKHVKCPTPQLKRLGRLKTQTRKPPEGVSSRLPLSDVHVNEDAVEFPPEKRRRRLAIRSFIDEEAGVDTDEDMDGDVDENDLIRAIEEEEADISGFINDTSQLGYSPDELGDSPDELGKADPDARVQDARTQDMHHALDNERMRAEQFKTPVLNRKMRGAKNRDSWDGKCPDSASGLGNMNFIRSVIEHHQQGGQAEEIEQLYNQLEEEASPIDEEALIPAREPPTKTVVYYVPSDSDDD